MLLFIWLKIYLCLLTRPHDLLASAQSNQYAQYAPSKESPNTELADFSSTDFLLLREGPSTLSADITGVFANTRLQPHLLCEFRGLLVSVNEELDPTQLRFSVTSPTGHNLTLIADDQAEAEGQGCVCAQIKDCAYVHGEYTNHDVELLASNDAVLPPLPGFSYNAVVEIIGSKVFISASRTIEKDEEIFVYYGSEYWVPHILSLKEGKNLFSSVAAAPLSTTATLTTNPESSSRFEIEAEEFRINSELLLLYAAPSTLGGDVGRGLFARVDIPAGTILCEYRGLVMDASDPSVSEYSFSIASAEIGQKVITAIPSVDSDRFMQRYSLAMYINDCVSLHDNYTENDIDNILSGEMELPLLHGCSYNAVPQREGSKVFAVATVDIKRGEEIFFSYSSVYWLPKLNRV